METQIYTFRESDDYEINNFGYAQPPSYIDSTIVYQGLKLEDEWKIPVFQMQDGEFSDYLDNSCRWVLCSQKLRAIIDEFSNNSNIITWLPVDVNNGEKIEKYFTLLIDFHLEDIVDFDKSKKLKNGDIYLPHFIYNKISNFDLFVYEEKPSSPFISKKLKLSLQESKITGLGFEEWKAS